MFVVPAHAIMLLTLSLQRAETVSPSVLRVARMCLAEVFPLVSIVPLVATLAVIWSPLLHLRISVRNLPHTGTIVLKVPTVPLNPLTPPVVVTLVRNAIKILLTIRGPPPTSSLVHSNPKPTLLVVLVANLALQQARLKPLKTA